MDRAPLVIGIPLGIPEKACELQLVVYTLAVAVVDWVVLVLLVGFVVCISTSRKRLHNTGKSSRHVARLGLIPLFFQACRMKHKDLVLISCTD